MSLIICLAAGAALAAAPWELRPPSVPLVAHDPYFSVWSPADKLTDADTLHWTGKPHSIRSLIRIDGVPYRLMGTKPAGTPALPQTGLQVLPTRTICSFACPEIRLTLTFMTAALPDDLNVLSRPVTYITWDVQAVDGKKHQVELYFDASSGLAVNTPEQAVTWSREKARGLHVIRVGTERQPVLAAKGDDRRIDWGYLYSAVPTGQGVQQAAVAGDKATLQFIHEGRLPTADDKRMPRAVSDEEPVLATALALTVDAGAQESRYLMLAYDDIYSINYFGKKLRPYWRRNGMDASGLLTSAAADYLPLADRCRRFDQKLMADLTEAGGRKYALICALLYRQCLAGNKLAADSAGMPMLFPKENTSNGCIGTVDVMFPMSPMFLLLSPGLSRAMLTPVLDYARSPRWPWPYSPHDVGCYPKATGQVYGGGESSEDGQMPVEESGDMIIMIAALARAEGNCEFAARYWPLLAKWAEYLKQFGMDPAHQLCTDDFAGPFAHNVNLSAKAIIALGAFGLMAEQTNHKEEAAEYLGLARSYAKQWQQMADDGDHTRLAFDRPNTWSQKYNLVWDGILGLNLFAPEIARKEAAYYRKIVNTYGVPLDSRNTFAKLDWSIWAASLSEDRTGFESLIDPIFRFLNEVEQRNPTMDLYATDKPQEVGMHARPVVGGAFIRILKDPKAWRRWVSAGAKAKGKWADFPISSLSPSPSRRIIVATAEKSPAEWRYTFEQPSGHWFSSSFDDSAWSKGVSGFGIAGTPGAIIGTVWNTSDIWLRRDFELADTKLKDTKLRIHYDEDAEVYINGILAAETTGYVSAYEDYDMNEAAVKALRPGRNTLAVHCRQTMGGQYIDVGIVEE